MILSRPVPLRMRNVSHEICIENQITHFTFNNFFFFENHSVYEKMWKNIVQPDSSQMTIWHMYIACWIPKATDTNPEYVIRIAFPL